ncbi:MAG: hypothetical protein Q7R52_03315 [archaeon]|nr:hypothetical protein [archaeon]
MKKRLIKTIFCIGVPALIAIIVFFIPSWIQEIFVLKMDHLTLWNWFTYIFVHENLPHLTRNIIFYLLAMITAYAICPKDNKNTFYKPFLVILFLTPFISLIITLLIWKLGGILLLNHRGFSGITSASIGILGFFIAKRIYILWNIKNKIVLLQLCYFVIFPSLAIMSWNLSKILSISVFLLWILMIFNLVLILRKEKIVLDNSKWNKKEFVIMAISLGILFFGALLLIPEKLINESGSAVNAIAHLIGFIVGFWTYFVWDIKSK